MNNNYSNLSDYLILKVFYLVIIIVNILKSNFVDFVSFSSIKKPTEILI